MYKNKDELLKLMDPVQHVLFRTYEIIDDHNQKRKSKGKKVILNRFMYEFGNFMNWFDRWSLQDLFPEVDDFDGDEEKFDEYQRRLVRKYH